eukprot:s11036_g1.t1
MDPTAPRAVSLTRLARQQGSAAPTWNLGPSSGSASTLLTFACTVRPWTAANRSCRLLPCPGLPAQLLAVNGDPAFSWSPERWHWARHNLGQIDPLLHALDLVGPLDHEERRALVSRSRNSRPGMEAGLSAILPGLGAGGILALSGRPAWMRVSG